MAKNQSPAGSFEPGLVSVLIVNYHAYTELSVCLETLAGSSRRPIETIVVDHDSRRSDLDALRGRHGNVTWLPSEDNPGFAAGVNRAARTARGEYFLLLNPDCIVEEDVCHALANWLDGRSDVGAVGCLIHDQDGTIQASARRFPDATTGFAGRTAWLTRTLPGNRFSSRNLLTGPDVREPIYVDWVSGACVMIRRNAFRDVDGMDEAFFLYWEDADFCYRLARAGWRTAYNPSVAVTHLCGRSSRSSARSIQAFHRSALRYFIKHGGPVARLTSPLAFIALQSRAALLMLRGRLG